MLFANGTLMFFSFFRNSTGPTLDTFYPGKNFNASGFGVCSVCIMIITSSIIINPSYQENLVRPIIL